MGEQRSADRVPPHSEEAESAVLGAILLQPEAMGLVAPVLRAEHFYRPDHQRVFMAFENLYGRNQPIDQLTVREELRRMKAESLATNADLFAALTSQVPSLGHAEHHATIVRQKSLLRELIKAATESIAEAYDERDDVVKILDRAEERVFAVATRFEPINPIQVREILQKVVDTIMNHPEKMVGTQTLYPDLDKLTGGLHRGEFIVIGGRPGSGKTTFALNLIERIGIRQGLGVLMFSLEMSSTQIVQNLLCCHAAIDSTPLRTGQFDRSQWTQIKEAASVLHETPILIDESPSLTVSQLRTKCRHVIAHQQQIHQPIELVVIDYLQLMTGERKGRDITRLSEITDISRGIKGLAKELNLPVIALSQLSRAAESEGESARPRLSHLRESGAIEQDADLVLLLYHDPNPEPEDVGKTELIVAKQRNGPTGTVNLTFRKEQLRFESWTRYPALQGGVAPPPPEDEDIEPA